MYDTEFAQFLAAYPASRRFANRRARAAFVNAIQQVPFATLLAALEQHKRSEQWRKHIMPSLITWLEQGYWVQELPEPEPPRSRFTPYEQAKRAGLK